VQQKIIRLIRSLEINGEEQTPNDTRDDSVRILRSLANEDPEIIDDLVTTLLTARRRDEKGNTVLAAGLQGNAKAVISRAITGSDDVSISLFGSVSAALDNPEEFVRSSAAELLGDAVESIPDYDAEIADALTNTYSNYDNYTFRKNAIESLGTVLIESPDPQDDILETLFTAIEDPHESVRKEAVRVLGKAAIDSNTNRDSILCHLVSSLDDNGNLVRSRSMSAIEELSEHDPDSVATYSESIVDVLVDRDGNSSVRSDAVRVLSRIGSRPETIEVLENRAVTVHRCANEEVFSPTNHTRLIDLLVRLDSEATIN
jgi:HEAT repeat protein